jgi:hypothetical protein
MDILRKITNTIVVDIKPTAWQTRIDVALVGYGKYFSVIKCKVAKHLQKLK